MNQAFIIGRLTSDAELKFLPGVGVAVTRFVVAVDRDYKKQDGTKETDFIPVEIMGKYAEVCVNFLRKGRLIAVTGSIRIDKYVTEAQETKSFTKIRAVNVKVLDKANAAAAPSELETSNKEIDPNGFQAIDDDDIPF